MLPKLLKSGAWIVSFWYTASLFGQPLPTLQLLVSREHVAAGGMAQVKVFLAAPAAIGSGNFTFQLDQTVFGDVAAGTVFSATGDAYGGIGTLNVTPGYFTVSFTSPSGGVGRLAGLPIFEFTVPVRNAGSASVGPVLAVSSLKDVLGRSYGVTLSPGTVTVGGTLALQNVSPGGGVVAAGSVMTVRGAGFTASTVVTIDQARISAVNFVNAQEIDVTLGAATEMTGKHVRVMNDDGAQVDYWGWLHNVPEGFGRYFGQHAILGLATSSSTSWALANRVGPGDAFGLALQNPTSAPVDVTVTNAVLLSGVQATGSGTVTQTIPAWGSAFVEVSNPPNTTVQTNPPTPIRVSGIALSGTPITFSGAFNLAGPNVSPLIGSVVNAASGVQNSISPGEIISIYGMGLGPRTATVSFDGMAAPVLYVSSSQINAIVPYAVSGATSTVISVQNASSWGIPVAGSAPGIFTLTGSGVGGGAVLNQDNSVNDATHAAARGSVIQIYGTGEGDTSPAGVTGSVTQGTLKKPVLPVTLTIGGLDSSVQYAGSAPGAVAGLLQVNAVVPSGVAPGPAVPVVVTVGSARSQAGVTVAVQ